MDSTTTVNDVKRCPGGPASASEASKTLTLTSYFVPYFWLLKIVMATSRDEGIHTFESQFPIVATNLRALVSSWLPPAREPSPVDDGNQVNGESEGRPERYR